MVYPIWPLQLQFNRDGECNIPSLECLVLSPLRAALILSALLNISCLIEYWHCLYFFVTDTLGMSGLET